MKHTLVCLSLLLVTSFAPARPAYRRALADLLELPAAAKLNDCQVCHLPLKQGADENDRPHNAFGTRLKELRAELRKANKPHDILARIVTVGDEDSDGDGFRNLHELLAGTFPGDKSNTPSAEALTEAKKAVAPLLESLRGYRWRPFDRAERPAPPVVKEMRNVRNSIDLFLGAEMENRGLSPRGEAPRDVLLRRVTIDLTGLPPTPEELRMFLADTSPNAYERVVDRLLSSPRYGERWGRHWMDVWRYSDWAGFGTQVRDSQPHIWHWRDWIIESLNANKTYDRMVTEMLAADEFAPTDTAALRATGFLVRNYKLLSREKWLQDVVDHTAQGFLGLTLNCARCHDHMYDPVTMKEYYQFRAIFTPHLVRTDRLPGFPNPVTNGLPRAYDADLNAPTFVLLRGDDRTPEKTPVSPGVPESLGGVFEAKPVTLPRDAYDPDRREFVTAETHAAAKADIEKTQARLVSVSAGTIVLDSNPLRALTKLINSEAVTLARLDAELAMARLTALEAVLRVEAMEPAGVKPSEEYQNAAKATQRTQRQVAVLEARRALLVARQMQPPSPAPAKQIAAAEQAVKQAETNAKLPETTAYTRRVVKSYPTTSSGRRLALAKWIVHRDNPLAARTAVNQVWLRHFGAGLAPGVFDLGRNAQKPTHPQLLDWLAVEFVDNGWNLKELHRLILTSAAYRRHSTPERDNLARDPDNVYLWRYSPRRVEAEVVRDSLFFVADRLDSRMGGPDISHTQTSVNRRSVYFQHAQEKQMDFLLLFDLAAVTECYQRRQAIVPQQALALANNELALRHARLLARDLHAQAKNGEAFVKAAFEKVLTREPTMAEMRTCAEFIAEQSAKFAGTKSATTDATGERPASDPVLRARENLVHVLLNHHEFVTIR